VTLERGLHEGVDKSPDQSFAFVAHHSNLELVHSETRNLEQRPACIRLIDRPMLDAHEGGFTGSEEDEAGWL